MTFPANCAAEERKLLQAICTTALTILFDLLRQTFRNNVETVEEIRGHPYNTGLTIEEIADAVGPVISYRFQRDPVSRLPIVPEFVFSAGARFMEFDIDVMTAMQCTIDWGAVGQGCKLLLWKALTCQWSTEAIPEALDIELLPPQYPQSPRLIKLTTQLLINLLDLQLIGIELLGIDGSHCRFIVDGLLHGHNPGMRRRFVSLITQALEQHEEQRQNLSIVSRYATRRLFINMLLKAPLPLWSLEAAPGLKPDEWFSCVAQAVRGLGNCFQAGPDTRDISLNATELLNREVDWIVCLLDQCEARGVALEEIPGANLRGHINLLNAFLGPCSGASKAEIGVDRGLLGRLLQQCLFPSAVAVGNGSVESVPPAVQKQMTRETLFELVASLCAGSADNTALVQHWIETYVLSNIVSDGFDWDPDCPGRRTHVGLRNGGATCYMNSVLQQLYMQPMLRHALLAVPEALENEHAAKQEGEQQDEIVVVEEGDSSEAKSGDHLDNLVANSTIKPLLNSDAVLTKVDVKTQLKDSILFHLQRIFANLQGLKQQVRNRNWNH